jgi:multidrug transporter EmrE-like cation transporter
MTTLNMFQIIALFLAAASLTAVFVLFRYWRFKKALETKPTDVSYTLYIWIAVKSLILIGCIYQLWKSKFVDVWVLLCLVYACLSLILFLFVLRRLQAWKLRARLGEQNE